MPNILYKLASRSRVTKLFATLDNIHSLAKHDDFTVLCSFDNDDTEYNNPQFLKRLKQYPKVIYNFSDNKTKIEAINADMNLVPDFDIVIVESDDQVWIQEGFDIEIIESFKKYAPNFDKLIHYPDQYGKSELCVKTIMGRKLYDQLGYLYFNGYLSQYADNDLTNSCRILNQYWFRPLTIYRHDHPAFNASLPKDSLYMRNMNLNMQATDNQLYIQRRDNNFGLY